MQMSELVIKVEMFDLYNSVIYNSASPGYPRIIEGPFMRAVDKDQSVMLRCSAAGTPTPIIQWMKDFLPLPSQDERFTIKPNGKIHFFRSFQFLPLIILKWLNTNVVRKLCRAL